MEFLSKRNALIGYVSGLTVIVGLMTMIFTGVTATDGKRGIASVSKISMIEQR